VPYILPIGVYGISADVPFLGHWVRRRYTIESVTHGQCATRPTVTFPAAEHCHCQLAGTHFSSRCGWASELTWVDGCELIRYFGITLGLIVVDLTTALFQILCVKRGRSIMLPLERLVKIRQILWTHVLQMLCLTIVTAIFGKKLNESRLVR